MFPAYLFSMQIRLRQAIFLSLFVTAVSVAAQEIRPTPIVNFVRNWQNQLAEEEFNKEQMAKYYAAQVSWYNTSVASDSALTIISSTYDMQQCIFWRDPTIVTLTDSSHATWQVFFDECNGVVSGMQQHYLLVESDASGTLHITAQSSLADDAWLIRKTEIANDTIVHENKRYYVLNRSYSGHPSSNHVIFFLTDSLKFDEANWIPVCTDDFGFTASGNIFCALAILDPQTIIAFKDITLELNQSPLEEAELTFGGFLCLHTQDSLTIEGKHAGFHWRTPVLNVTYDRHHKTSVLLKTDYNYGDACWSAETTILFDSKKKKITTKQFIRKPHKDARPG